MKPGSFTQMYVHLVFAVYNRENILSQKNRLQIYEYISGIIRGMRHKSIIVNGVSDHIHILLGLNPAVSVSDTVHDIKRNSTIFINSHRFTAGRFSWQEGYGAFTYSRSQIQEVFKYINEQEIHHSRRTFKEEYLSLLERYEIEFDPRFLFEFYDHL